MIHIDGSHGEGGGQILRTSLALALVTGASVRIDNIRAKRKKPGLLRQHLTAFNAATAIGQARVEGNTLGSRTVSFHPNGVHPGTYQFAVGSAGSCTLVLQAVLPALMTASGSSELILEGGTHNPFAPPFEFIQRAFLPLVNRMGPAITVKLERAGFYPAGGGRIKVKVTPVKTLKKMDLPARGALVHTAAHAMVARLPEQIAQRELKVVREKMEWPVENCRVVSLAPAPGPGNALVMEIGYEHVTEVFTGFGRKGVRAEKVAADTVKAVNAFDQVDAAVGPYLADQLLIPMALAGGGTFTTVKPTLHTKTNAQVIQRFLSVGIEQREIGAGVWQIRIVD